MQENCTTQGNSCSNVIYQTVDVDLPISLSPSIYMGNATVLCCGEPRVVCCEAGSTWGGLTLKITQTVTYKIPIEYGIGTAMGDVTTACSNAFPHANCSPIHC